MNEYLKAVLNWGFEQGVGYQLCYRLSPVTPSGSNPKSKTVVINMNWHDPAQLPYQAAHEIGHVLNQDSGSLYMFTPSKVRYEGEANKRAIDILVPIYFEDVYPEDANIQEFLDSFHIPEKMRDWAKDSIQRYYL